MVEDAVYQIKVKVGNKSEFKRDVQKMLDEGGYLGSSVKSVKGAGAKAGGGGFMGGMMGGMTKMLGAAGVAIMILDQFKGITNLVSAIMRVLIEFLRPIADVVMLLLMPVLMILRPILMIVRQLMAPFRKSAFQLAAMGSKLMKNGDITGGLGMFGQAMMTILAGFVPILTTWWGVLLKFVVDIGAGLVKMMAGVVFDVAALLAKGVDAIAGFFGLKTNLEEGVRSAQTKFDTGIDNAAKDLKTKIDENVKTFNTTFTDWVIKAATKSIAASEAQLSAAEKMSTYLDDNGGSDFGPLKPGAKSDTPSFDQPGSGLTDTIIANISKGGMKSYTDTIKEGFATQKTLSTDYVGEGGLVPQTMIKGFDTVKASSVLYNKAMHASAIGVSKAVDIALRAADKAVSNANAYARALRSLEAKRS